MASRKPLTDAEGEVRELTKEDLANGVPFSALPASLQAKLRKPRGPQIAPKKDRITIRLSRDVVAQFRATGPGWQGRMDQALQEWLTAHSIA
jgi:uncharacterized protein (DUF4415 family)